MTQQQSSLLALPPRDHNTQQTQKLVQERKIKPWLGLQWRYLRYRGRIRQAKRLSVDLKTTVYEHRM